MEAFPGLLSLFPRYAPDVVVPEGGDGDYGQAQEMFALHGSDWDCQAVLPNRGLINFLNDEAFRFLLPRMICCAYSEKGIDADILDYVIFGLQDKITRFADLFSDAQRSALIQALKILKGFVVDEYVPYEDTVDEIQRILDALEAADAPP